MPHRPFRVLYVCTANLCRSPMAELLLRQSLIQRWGEPISNTWLIESAGVLAGTLQPIHDSAALVMNERGISSSDFRSRKLRPSMLHSADLILTAERLHRATVVRMVPSALRRTVTIKQFARLAAAVGPITAPTPASLGRALRAEALAQRNHLQPVDPEHDNLDDPIGHPVSTFRTCADELQATIDVMLNPIELPVARRLR